MGRNHHDILVTNKSVRFTDAQRTGNIGFHYHLVTHEKIDTPDYDYCHYHDSFEIHYVTEGFHEMKIGHDTYNCVPGEILCISPNQIHYSLHTTHTKTWRIMIENSHLKSLGIDFDMYTVPTKIEDPKVAGLMSEMFQDAISQQAYNYIKCYGIALQMLIYIYRNLAKPIMIKSNQNRDQLTIISDAIKYIENNYSEELSFSKLAGQLGYSPSYFSRIFTKATGVSAAKYLIKTRCLAAEKLIKNNYTITEASEKCGFSNPSYFIKTYKKVMGHLPSDDKNTK